MSPQNCSQFGQIAHNNRNDLYIASLNVGTGECQIVRQGDNAIIIDAGIRGALIDGDNIVAFISLMLGYDHNHNRTNNNIAFQKATLLGVFITHPHSDHKNILDKIMREIPIYSNITTLKLFLVV